MKRLVKFFKDNLEDIRDLFLDERKIQSATYSHHIFGSVYHIITKSLGRKYDLVIASLIRSCLSGNYRISIDSYGISIDSYVGTLIKQVNTKLPIGDFRVNFSEIKKEEVAKRMISKGLIRKNKNEDGIIGDISDTSHQYSLTQYALIWLSIIDQQEMSNKLPERLKVIAIFVAVILTTITVLYKIVAGLFDHQIIINLFL